MATLLFAAWWSQGGAGREAGARDGRGSGITNHDARCPGHETLAASHSTERHHAVGALVWARLMMHQPLLRVPPHARTLELL